MNYYYLLLLLLLPRLSRTHKVGVARFQIGNVTTTNSLLDAGEGALPSLRQVTLLTHLRLRRLTSHVPILSYAVNDSFDELFVELVPKKNDIHVKCCRGLVSGVFHFVLRKFTWQHLCVALDLEAGVLRVFFDNMEYTHSLKEAQEEAAREGRQLEVRGGGRLVVGQKLYSLGGDFMLLETLDGEAGDWRLFDLALPPDTMRSLIQCRVVPGLPNPIIDLLTGHFEVVGDATTYNTTVTDMCDDGDDGFYLFFPQRMSYSNAKSWCKKIKGNVVLPRDADTNAFLVDTFLGYRDTCAQIWTHLFWIGSEGDVDQGTWKEAELGDDDEGDVLGFAPFLQEYDTVQPEVKCVAAVSHNRYRWAASPCDMETCVLCAFASYHELRLHGLCRDSSFDRLFSFRDSRTYDLVFDGVSHVVMEEQGGTWVMRSRLYPNLRAEMLSQWAGQYPVGVHSWRVEGDRCREKEVTLLLTSCSDKEYTCDDGSCVSTTDRCDLYVDCPDQSDETNCSVVLLPPGYSPSLPPPPPSSRPLPIALSLTITSVREFDLSSFSISVDAHLRLSWKDFRLRFSNLVADYRANKLKDSSEVWVPSLVLQDGTRSTVDAKVHSQATYVLRKSGPLPDDDTTLRKDVMYSGGQNPLLLRKELTLTFKCHFHLQMYPFDLQECLVALALKDVTQNVGILVRDGPGVSFEGARHLLEYTVLGEEFAEYSVHNVSHVKVVLNFHNQFSYYIANTFLPSLIQVIIGISTLRFDIADFQDRIMVSLTSLLVLATFFTQTSQSIPRTSYLKLIDVWFVALIFLDFTIIMSLVCVETLRLRTKHPIGGYFAAVAPLAPPSSGCFTSCKRSLGRRSRKASYMMSLSRPEEVNSILFRLFSWSVVLVVGVFVCVCMYGVLDEH
ncbi:uncharacterized protein LOC126986351 [Eriocheir sinensis]|uniref:uncharacterized protein LOC126986351 n=1 Tax=Eriocheir sinensis TaxID=95602 RepID=UPI0021C7FC4D|nr:uncharacterized protein LOC126986351 [Eriocheir sinensis]